MTADIVKTDKPAKAAKPAQPKAKAVAPKPHPAAKDAAQNVAAVKKAPSPAKVATTQPPVEKPVAEKTVVEKSAAPQTPVAEKLVAEKSVAEKPAPKVAGKASPLSNDLGKTVSNSLNDTMNLWSRVWPAFDAKGLDKKVFTWPNLDQLGLDYGFQQARQITQAFQEALSGADETNTPKSYSDVYALAEENVEALAQANSVLTSGLQELTKAWSELGQKAISSQVDVARKIASAKSVHEAVDIQTKASREQLDQLIELSMSLNKDSLKLAEQAFGPLGERMQAILTRLTKV